MSDLDLMVREIKTGTQAAIVLVSVYYITAYQDKSGVWDRGDREGTHAYNAAIRQYAEANDALYADVYSAQGAASWGVDKDGIHPNNLGHALIANKVFEVIATHCRCLSLKSSRAAENYFRWADAREQVLRTYQGI